MLNDINYVLELNSYPENLIKKLFWRKAYSHFYLNDVKLAIDSFEKFLKLISDDDKSIPLRNQVQNDLRNLMMRKNVSLNDNFAETTITLDVNDINPLYESCHKSVDISFEPNMGRYAKANDFLEIGKTILVEKPFCSVLHSSKWLTHCQYCFKRFVLSIFW